MRIGRGSLVAAAVLLVAAPAVAHDGTGLQGGFVAGVLHPLSGPDHMLAMVAVGIWGAFLGRPLVAALPVVFPGVMAVGGVLGILGVAFPAVELGIALSVIVLGAVIAGAVRAPVPAACTLVAAFALFHGYAHGAELPSAADPLGYSVGFVFATGMLHVAGILFGGVRRYRFGTTVMRGAGVVIAVIGFVFLLRAI